MILLNKIFLKRIFNRFKNILLFPKDIKFIFFRRKIKTDGIVLVIHESNRLGASLLLLHTAEELVKHNKNVYIISLQFGELNKEYNKIAPVQIIFSKFRFKITLRKLKKQYGYKKILMITAAIGDFVKSANDLDYQIISEIHELPFVIKSLGLINATKSMLIYSDNVIFSTEFAKEEILNLTNTKDSSKFVVRPQGTYFKKPVAEKINYEERILRGKYPVIIDKKVVIGIGNTSKRKGFDIFADVARKMPQYIFIWAGRKENFFNVVKKEKNGLSDNLIYLGQLNDEQLAGVYSIASVLLLSSRVDTLPSTIFEALLFSVPVIGAKTSGGVTEVINNMQNGLLTNETSVNAFICAINECFSSPIQEKLCQHFNKTSFNSSFSNYVSFIIHLYS